jgi:hypothetical protein
VRLEHPVPTWARPRLRRAPSTACAETRSANETIKAPRALLFAFASALVALTLLDRFGLRLSDSYSIHPSLVASYGLAAVMLVTDSARIDRAGVLMYVAVVTVAALSFVINASLEPHPSASIGSLMLVFVLYAPFVLRLRPSVGTPELWQLVIRWYIRIALLCALAGIAQFYAQFVFDAPWLFDYRPFIPAAIRGSGIYNTTNYAGALVKSNGFFLREASGLSFYMALALICEASFAKRKWVLAVLALALVVSYSGSGLLALGTAMLFPLGKRSLARVLLALVAGAIFVLLFGDALNLYYTLGRLDEFDPDATTSSAYYRFVAPAKLLAAQFDSAPWTALLGHGPGTTQKFGADVFATTYGKLLFEYGLGGAIAFGALVLAAIGRSAAPVRIRVALIVSWFFLGGNLVTPDPLLLIFLITGVWPAAPRQARTLRARVA